LEIDNKRMILAMLALIALTSFTTPTATAESIFEVEALDLTVYRDGLVHVKQKIIVNELSPQIILPLLSPSIENVLVLDDNQLAVDYEIEGSNLTILTLGSEIITVEYDTVSLTKKEAEVWTFTADFPYNLTVFLPQNSTVIYLNKMPTAIDTSGTGIALTLYAGYWEISYVVPLLPPDENNDKEASEPIPIEYLILIVVALASIILSVPLIVRRRKGPNAQKILKANPQLKKEDREVILFLAEKDGKAFEAEIRERFSEMPRTSLWRLVRRLERLEIVEVKRIGLENQVQLKK
jgi:uncharacterized membrane protein